MAIRIDYDVLEDVSHILAGWDDEEDEGRHNSWNDARLVASSAYVVISVPDTRDDPAALEDVLQQVRTVLERPPGLSITSGPCQIQVVWK
jgi:hypothetical protein